MPAIASKLVFVGGWDVAVIVFVVALSIFWGIAITMGYVLNENSHVPKSLSTLFLRRSMINKSLSKACYLPIICDEMPPTLGMGHNHLATNKLMARKTSQNKSYIRLPQQ